MEELLDLGGNIQLQGFSKVDPGQMVVVKKIVGNYAKKFSEVVEDFQELKISMKNIHGEQTDNFELKARLFAGGNPIVSEVNDRNLFFGLDKSLKNIESQLS